MFFEKMNKQAALIKVEELLKPYLYLDVSKVNGNDMKYKFTNDGLGVAEETQE